MDLRKVDVESLLGRRRAEEAEAAEERRATERGAEPEAEWAEADDEEPFGLGETPEERDDLQAEQA